MHQINPRTSHALKAQHSPRWHRVYYLLAAFNVLVVLSGLGLTHELLKRYERSVEVNQQWVEQKNLIADLGTLAGVVNAPANDVFNSYDVERESARTQAALQVFDEHLAILDEKMLAQIASGDGSSAADLEKLPEDLAAIKIAMPEMVNESKLIFSYFQGHQPEMAARRMATMDRKYAQVLAALSQLREHTIHIQEKLFQREIQSAKSLSRFEYLLGSLMLLMVAGALVYGHNIKRQIETGTREKERFLKDLEAEIIERKAIESALRDSEERHRDLFENANDIVYTHDLAGN